MKVLALVACLALTVMAVAQENLPPAEEEGSAAAPQFDPAQADQLIQMHVQMEEMVARRWLELVLKIQHAQYNSLASMMIMHTMSLEAEEKHKFNTRHEDAAASTMSDFEDSELTQDYLEDSDENILANKAHAKQGKAKASQSLVGYGTLWGGYNGMEDDSSNYNQDKLNLIADYYFFYAIKIWYAQTIYRIGDIQREFWMDRAMQLGVATVGQGLPPQVYQLLYLKVFRTYLETLKYSFALQMISHWVTWLEDGIDVYGAKVDQSNPYWESVVQDQSDDLIRDKMWAFSAYRQYAQLDFSVFYLDLYLEASLAPLLGGQGSFGQGSFGSFAPPAQTPAAEEVQPSATALLEEEAQVEAEPTQTKSFGPNAGVAAPYMLMKMFKWTHLLFQYMAAHSAYTAASTEQLAYNKYDEGDYEASGNFRQFAQQMMASFGQNLYQASNIQKGLAMWELYIMVAPLFAGGSFGAQGGSLPGGSF